jgi:membrane protease subunit (stomatin/prohibitin family)
MKSRNEVNKEEIIKEYGEEFFNALELSGERMSKLLRQHKSNKNEFAKKMYEKLDKLKEENKKNQ